MSLHPKREGEEAQRPPTLFDRTTMLAGATAGFVGTLLGYPLDTIKSRLALAAIETKGNSVPKGTFARAIHIARSTGIRGLYSGVASPLASLVILNTMSFSTFGFFCKTLGIDNSETILQRDFALEPSFFAAGGLSGVLAAFVSTPFELLKVTEPSRNRLFVGYS